MKYSDLQNYTGGDIASFSDTRKIQRLPKFNIPGLSGAEESFKYQEGMFRQHREDTRHVCWVKAAQPSQVCPNDLSKQRNLKLLSSV